MAGKVKRSAAKKAAPKKKAPAKMEQPVHGTFMWNELMTRDDVRALDFFRNVLGWTHEDWPLPQGGAYRIAKIKGRDKGVAGILKMTEPEFPPQVPPHWCSYVAVDDVDKRAELVRKFGGEIIHGPADIPQVGRFCILKDPTGAVMAFMTTIQGVKKA